MATVTRSSVFSVCRNLRLKNLAEESVCRIFYGVDPVFRHSWAVASPGFVVRRGNDGNYVMWHLRWTLGPGAAAARRRMV